MAHGCLTRTWCVMQHLLNGVAASCVAAHGLEPLQLREYFFVAQESRSLCKLRQGWCLVQPGVQMMQLMLRWHFAPTEAVAMNGQASHLDGAHTH